VLLCYGSGCSAAKIVHVTLCITIISPPLGSFGPPTRTVDEIRLGCGAQLTVRNMRAHFIMCANRPAASGDGHIISTMTLKGAVFFALIGMALLTVLLAVGFVRDVSASLAGAIAAITLLASLIHLLASLSVTVFFYVFHKAQS